MVADDFRRRKRRRLSNNACTSCAVQCEDCVNAQMDHQMEIYDPLVDFCSKCDEAAREHERVGPVNCKIAESACSQCVSPTNLMTATGWPSLPGTPHDTLRAHEAVGEAPASSSVASSSSSSSVVSSGPMGFYETSVRPRYSASRLDKEEMPPVYCHWGDHHDDVSFNSLTELDNHVLQNHVQKGADLSCQWDSCDVSLQMIDELFDHIKNEHLDSSQIPHTECHSTKGRDAVSSHQESHKQKREEHCPWTSCDFTTDNAASLAPHVYKSHIDLMAATPASPSEALDPFRCAHQECHFEAADYRDFAAHVRNEHFPSMWMPVSPDEAAAAANASTPSTSSTPMISDFLGGDHSSDNSFSQHQNHAQAQVEAQAQAQAQAHAQAHAQMSHYNQHQHQYRHQHTHEQQHQHQHQHHPQQHGHHHGHGHTETDKGCVCEWLHDDGSVCGRHFDNCQKLTEHLETEHVKTRQKEYFCRWQGCERHNKPFKQRQKIARHLQVHTNNKPFRCDVCGHSFGEMHVLRQHMRVHSGEKPYECKVCGKRFAVSTALSVHMRTHTGEKPLMCKFPGCGKRFSESSNLAKHMKTHQRKLDAQQRANAGAIPAPTS